THHSCPSCRFCSWRSSLRSLSGDPALETSPARGIPFFFPCPLAPSPNKKGQPLAQMALGERLLRCCTPCRLRFLLTLGHTPFLVGKSRAKKSSRCTDAVGVAVLWK